MDTAAMLRSFVLGWLGGGHKSERIQHFHNTSGKFKLPIYTYQDQVNDWSGTGCDIGHTIDVTDKLWKVPVKAIYLKIHEIHCILENKNILQNIFGILQKKTVCLQQGFLKFCSFLIYNIEYKSNWEQHWIFGVFVKMIKHIEKLRGGSKTKTLFRLFFQYIVRKSLCWVFLQIYLQGF